MAGFPDNPWVLQWLTGSQNPGQPQEGSSRTPSGAHGPEAPLALPPKTGHPSRGSPGPNTCPTPSACRAAGLQKGRSLSQNRATSPWAAACGGFLGAQRGGCCLLFDHRGNFHLSRDCFLSATEGFKNQNKQSQSSVCHSPETSLPTIWNYR